MKTIYALVLLVISQSSFANCYQYLDSRLQNSMASKHHDYFGIEQVRAQQVVSILRNSEELNPAEKSQIGKLLQSRNFEFYVMYAAVGQGGYQDIFAVSKNSCSTYRRFNIYVE